MLTLRSANEARARVYYWLWGVLPVDWAAELVEDGFIISELEASWDREFQNEIER